MRMASFKRDFSQLRSAVDSHREHPTTFSIPPIEARENLKRGDAAKLIFDIEGYDEDGSIVVGGERIWVVIAECVGDAYIGILDAQPSVEQSEDIYLRFGAEVPFRPEHVIEIAQPPTEYVEWQLGQPPERILPRNE